MNALSTQ